jgi:hypothetical protein
MKEQTFIFPGVVTRNWTRLIAFLSSQPEGLNLKVVVSEAKKDRSLEQNNALYGVAYKALSEFTGYIAPELHEMFLRSYFGEVEVEVMGKRFVKARRTTTTDESGKRQLLSTIEFNDFYRYIQQKGAELGCWVPDPDPMWHLHQEDVSRAA